MAYTEQNPPPVQSPYDYTNPDLRQVAALIAQGQNAPFSGITGVVSGSFTNGLSGQQLLPLNPNKITPSVCKVGIIFSDYAISENDVYIISIPNYFTGAALELEKGKLIDILQTPSGNWNNTGNQYFTRAYTLDANQTIEVSIDTVNAVNSTAISVISSELTFDNLQTNEQQTLTRAAASLQTLSDNSVISTTTQVKILTSNNASNLETAVQNYINTLPPATTIKSVSYAIDPAGGGNSHQALIIFK